MDKFIHFRTQSSYSMLESTIKIGQLVELAKNNKMSAICLADRNNFFASLEFSIEAVKNKVKPIHGVLLNILFDKSTKSLNKDNFAEIFLIAKDENGYKNLLKLVSNIYTKNDRSVLNHITMDDLINHSEGIIVLSSYTEGIIGKYLLNNSFDQALKFSQKLKEIFGDRFYFEIMRHGYDREKKIESDYLSIAKKLSIPLIATNNVLFSDLDMYEAHDVLLCISEGVTVEENKRKRVSNDCYFKSPEKMINLFADLPEAIENTIHLAKRCSIIAETREPSLPNFSVDGKSESELLYKESLEGLENRLEDKYESEGIKEEKEKLVIREEYLKRLDYEFDIISKMNFSGYFLIVSDFIKWSKNNKIAVGPGRGSGAGSIIAWSLQITNLDPIKFGLLFERFLNPERVSMPDFDIDFCQERRDEVISYVRSKYGDDRVGQIITFGKLQAKAVVKDVARVLGLAFSQANRITELIPFNAVNPVTLKQAIDDVPELKQAYDGKGLYNASDDKDLIRQVLITALSLEGLHRHASIHAAGIVISNKKMTEIVPVYKDVNAEMCVVQYSMKYCELAGLVKFDFLGLQTLTVITKTLELVKSVNNIDIDIDHIILNDKKTFKMLTKGLSTGVFQFESVGMKSALRKLMPDSIDDLIALGALYRPGPMENIPTYIDCKNGKKEVDYLHPSLKKTLKSTYGVIIYQEQVMEIAQLLSGYSLGAADLLRRAMGKKVKKEMDAQKEIFVSGAVANNVNKSQAESIFNIVAKFAGYGFNKSHACAYGMISYQTAYLKANYPSEFLVASLNLDIYSSDKIAVFLYEANLLNIEIITPDINKSSGYFVIDTNNKNKPIIFAIGAIKNVTVNFGNIVSEEREKNGKFKSIIDFIERISPKLINKRLLENLIKSGCFDSLHDNRNSLLVSIPKIMSYADSFHQEQSSNQISLIAVNTVSADVIENNIEKFNVSDLASIEFDSMGLFLNNHPMAFYKEHQNFLDSYNIKNIKYIIDDLPYGSHSLNIAGVIVKKDSRMSQRGSFTSLIISDLSGVIDVTIFDDEVLKQISDLNKKEKKKSNNKEEEEKKDNSINKVYIKVDIFKDKGGVRANALEIQNLDKVLQEKEHQLSLYPKNMDELRSIFKKIETNSENKENIKCSLEIFLEIEKKFLAKIKIPNPVYLDKNNFYSLV